MRVIAVQEHVADKRNELIDESRLRNSTRRQSCRRIPRRNERELEQEILRPWLGQQLAADMGSDKHADQPEDDRGSVQKRFARWPLILKEGHLPRSGVKSCI